MNNLKWVKNFIFLTLAFALSGCGTTSHLRNSQGSHTYPDLSGYNHLIINDFGDGVSKSQDDQKILSEGKRFADIITTEVKAKKIFDKVERNTKYNGKALLIDGKITEYQEGSAAARMLIGLGAGSSHFDAKVNIKDNKTKKNLGEIDVNKMSWALGGAIAASQDVKSHMNSAASKIANELASAKKNPK